MNQTRGSVGGSGVSSSGAHRAILQEMNELADKLMIPRQVRTRAASIFTEATTMNFGRSTPHQVLAAASLYVVSREWKNPITLRDLAFASGSDPRDVGRCYLQILEHMHISRPELNGKGYVYRLALNRPVSEQSRKFAQEMINGMLAKGVGGRNPMTLAAASLYLACCSMGENVTQAELAEAAGVGEESVRECCKEIRSLARPS